MLIARAHALTPAADAPRVAQVEGIAGIDAAGVADLAVQPHELVHSGAKAGGQRRQGVALLDCVLASLGRRGASAWGGGHSLGAGGGGGAGSGGRACKSLGRAWWEGKGSQGG